MDEYVALQPIHHDGVLAYAPGDPVPGDNVRRHTYTVGVQVEAVKPPADDEQEPDGDQTSQEPPKRAARAKS